MPLARAALPRLFVGVVVVGLVVANAGTSWPGFSGSLALAAPANCAQTPPPSTPSFIAQAFTKAVASQPDVPGVALALYYNGTFYTYYTGYADRAKATCISDSTVMEIGSVTKSLTAIVLAMAYATSSPIVFPSQNPTQWANTLSAGNRVGQGCSPPPSATPVPTPSYGVIKVGTLQTLSTFMAGLPDLAPPYWNELKNRPCWSPNQFVNFVETFNDPTKPPGKYLYSDMSYGMLGYVLQGIYNKLWFDLTQEQLLRPLGMNHTYNVGHVTPTATYAQGYYCKGKKAPRWPENPWPAAGSLRSILPDMMKYLGAVVAVPSTPPNITAGISLAVSPIATVKPNVQQAMAWAIFKRGGYYVTAKDGATAGFSSWIGAILPATNPSSPPIGIVVLTNRHAYPNNECGGAPANRIGFDVLFAAASATESQTPRR